MLLAIHNLPPRTQYNDIKDLIKTKCAVQDCIVDNLEKDHNGRVSVTVGLMGEEDAAMVMRKLNGLYYGGNQLVVQDKRQKSQQSHVTPPTPVEQYGYSTQMDMSNMFIYPYMTNSMGQMSVQNPYMGYGLPPQPPAMQMPAPPPLQPPPMPAVYAQRPYYQMPQESDNTYGGESGERGGRGERRRAPSPYSSHDSKRAKLEPTVERSRERYCDRSQDRFEDRSQGRFEDRSHDRSEDRSRDRSQDSSRDRYGDRSRDRSRDMARDSAGDWSLQQPPRDGPPSHADRSRWDRPGRAPRAPEPRVAEPRAPEPRAPVPQAPVPQAPEPRPTDVIGGSQRILDDIVENLHIEREMEELPALQEALAAAVTRRLTDLKFDESYEPYEIFNGYRQRYPRITDFAMYCTLKSKVSGKGSNPRKLENFLNQFSGAKPRDDTPDSYNRKQDPTPGGNEGYNKNNSRYDNKFSGNNGGRRNFTRFNDDNQSYDDSPYANNDGQSYGYNDCEARGDNPRYGPNDDQTYGANDDPGYGDNDGPTYGDNDGPTYGDNDDPTYGDNDVPAYSDNDGPGYGADNEPTYSDYNNQSYGGKDGPRYGAKNYPSYGSKNNPSNSGKNNTNTDGKNNSSYSGKNYPNDWSKNVPSYGGKNATSYGGKNATSYGGKNATSYGGKNATSYGAKNAPTAGAKNVPSFGNKKIPNFISNYDPAKSNYIAAVYKKINKNIDPRLAYHKFLQAQDKSKQKDLGTRVVHAVMEILTRTFIELRISHLMKKANPVKSTLRKIITYRVEAIALEYRKKHPNRFMEPLEIVERYNEIYSQHQKDKEMYKSIKKMLEDNTLQGDELKNYLYSFVASSSERPGQSSDGMPEKLPTHLYEKQTNAPSSTGQSEVRTTNQVTKEVKRTYFTSVFQASEAIYNELVNHLQIAQLLTDPTNILLKVALRWVLTARIRALADWTDALPAPELCRRYWPLYPRAESAALYKSLKHACFRKGKPNQKKLNQELRGYLKQLFVKEPTPPAGSDREVTENVTATQAELAQAQHATVQAQDETVQAQDETVQALDETVQAQDETVQAQDETVQAQDETVQPQNETARAQPATPPYIPTYPDANKKQAIQQKREDKKALLAMASYNLKEPLKSALKVELKEFSEVVKNVLKQTSESERDALKTRDLSFCTTLCTKLLTYNLTKRLTNSGLKLCRIFGHPKPPTRRQLIDFLAKYNCRSLKKSVKSVFFVATFDSFATIDELCEMGNIPLDDVTITFKPMHMEPKKPRFNQKRAFNLRVNYIKSLIDTSTVNILRKDWPQQEEAEKQRKAKKADIFSSDDVIIIENKCNIVDITQDDEDKHIGNKPSSSQVAEEGNVPVNVQNEPNPGENRKEPEESSVVDKIQAGDHGKMEVDKNGEFENQIDDDWDQNGEDWGDVQQNAGNEPGTFTALDTSAEVNAMIDEIGEILNADVSQNNEKVGENELDNVDTSQTDAEVHEKNKNDNIDISQNDDNDDNSDEYEQCGAVGVTIDDIADIECDDDDLEDY